MDDRERLTRLEERFLHLQRHLAEQDKAMLGLGDELARLRRELARLRAQTSAGGAEGEPPAEKPPHY